MTSAPIVPVPFRAAPWSAKTFPPSSPLSTRCQTPQSFSLLWTAEDFPAVVANERVSLRPPGRFKGPPCAFVVLPPRQVLGADWNRHWIKFRRWNRVGYLPLTSCALNMRPLRQWLLGDWRSSVRHAVRTAEISSPPSKRHAVLNFHSFCVSPPCGESEAPQVYMMPFSLFSPFIYWSVVIRENKPSFLFVWRSNLCGNKSHSRGKGVGFRMRM